MATSSVSAVERSLDAIPNTIVCVHCPSTKLYNRLSEIPRHRTSCGTSSNVAELPLKLDAFARELGENLRITPQIMLPRTRKVISSTQNEIFAQRIPSTAETTAHRVNLSDCVEFLTKEGHWKVAATIWS